MKFDYEVLVAVSPLPRGEFLNIGLVVWRNDFPEIYAGVTPQRLAALDPNYPRLPIFKTLMAGESNAQITPLLEPVRHTKEALRMLLDMLIAPMKRGSGGEIYCDSEAELDARIQQLMEKLVLRQALTVPGGTPRPQKSSRLNSQMKDWFRQAKIMGRHMDDLARHRIVECYPVAVDADAYADFAYKNGALHVIETLDLRGKDHLTPAMRNTAAFKGVVLDMAREVVGDGKRLAIVAASDYAAVKGAVRMFSRNADDLFSMDSPADRQRLADLLAAGLHIEAGITPLMLN